MKHKPVKLRKTAGHGLRGKKVYLVFGVTGGGTEYLVDVFSTRRSAKSAASYTSAKGRIAWLETKLIK